MIASAEERLHRQTEIMKALEMFPEEKNITKALILYNKTLNQEDRLPVFVGTKKYRDKATVFDLYERPLCPECGVEMGFRRLKDNEDGFNTQLVCRNEYCDVVLNSEYTVEEWMETLRKEYESKRDAIKGETSK